MAKKKILIVDDFAELRELIRLTLQSNDWQLYEAASGGEALQMVYSIRPDLVLLDVMMPGTLDGLQVCNIIKSDASLSGMKVFLLTARAQKKDIEEGLHMKADAYLVKPFSPLELLEIIESNGV